jgi:outer membrane autotransporter protein
MIRRFAIAIGTCVLIAATHADAAGNSGPYIGIGGGLARLGIDDSQFRESAVALKAFGGYSFSDLIAFEGAYIRGGDPTEEVAGGMREATSSGYNVSVLLRARTASSFAVFAKVGYATHDVKLTETVSGVTTDLVDESTKGLSYGLGVTYTIARKYLVRAEYEGISVHGGSFDMVSIGAGYRF